MLGYKDIKSQSERFAPNLGVSMVGIEVGLEWLGWPGVRVQSWLENHNCSKVAEPLLDSGRGSAVDNLLNASSARSWLSEWNLTQLWFVGSTVVVANISLDLVFRPWFSWA